MRFLVFLLALSACATPEAARPAPTPPASVIVRAPSPEPAPEPVLDPAGRPSPLAASRDVALGGVSIVGLWRADAVLDDEASTADLRRGVLEKVLVVNPTGRATLRGWDSRDASGVPVAFSGRIEGSTLRLLDLPGAATLWLRDGRLHVADPGGTTTVYVWQGR